MTERIIVGADGRKYITTEPTRKQDLQVEQPVSMEPVGKICWAADIPKSIREVRLKGDAIFAPIGTALYTATQLAAARQQGAEEERKKHCACQWDADDNRTHTCVRHQGWLDVIEEWSTRAKDAEKCEDAYAKRIADLEKSNAQLLEALKDTLEVLELYCGEYEQHTRNQARAAIEAAEVKP